ncbi:hypothetical protein PR202_ga22728 [Eleusine coracana subsp. coracana]|uniref:Pectinesterase n=1 Tax=Eleusine coracana subsp. coracana TaxID=191504 RepID=A0AAV5D4P5_ELECO|nr:hypothetical protein QOZ80_9AG0692430 [Eleusine coracana subsp. coracana]GJN05123.1 hypothetical protein PR202_ga22728 [Eleusine coracana subsp. coracana]
MVVNKETLILSLLLGLLVFVSQPVPSYQEVDFYDWVTQQPANTTDEDAGCAKKDASLSSVEAIRVNNIIDPSATDEGRYNTIGASIANIPDGNTKRYVLTLKAGTVYHEKVFLDKSKPFVTIRSEDPYNPAVIVWSDTAATLGKDGKPLGINGSSTVTIESDYFISYGVVFKNDAPLSKPWAKNAEAPALRVLGTKATIYNCTIDGGQGALYDQMGLHYYKSSTIKGTVDFIFGFAKSLYEDCRIISMNKDAMTLPIAPQPRNAIKAVPGESGFSFKTCTVEGEGQQIYLGRVDLPFMYSYSKIDKEIVPIIYGLDSVQTPTRGEIFGMFKCHRPDRGAPIVFDLNYAEAKPFIGTHFISGNSWIPSLPPAE